MIGRMDASAPHEVVLVLDAGIGQNALSQVREFDAAVGVTGPILTKLDGTARAGVLFNIARQSGKAVCFIGVGEGIEHLRPFSADAFVDALRHSGPRGDCSLFPNGAGIGVHRRPIR